VSRLFIEYILYVHFLKISHPFNFSPRLEEERYIGKYKKEKKGFTPEIRLILDNPLIWELTMEEFHPSVI
jgi:hypothetical protein